MPRLFIAIDIPQQAKSSLAQLSRELPLARWVPEEQLHLTLRFLGDVGPQGFSDLKALLSRLSFRSFPLALRGCGHFPPGRRPPRVLWVGLQASEALMQLQRDLELLLLEIGIPPDERPFSPHLTLARLKDPALAPVTAFEQRHADLASPTFEVREVILYSSLLKAQGAIHTREFTATAQGSAPGDAHGADPS